jgi:hypothetical protein
MTTMAEQIAIATNQTHQSTYYTDYIGELSILSYRDGESIYDGATSCYDALSAVVADLPTAGGIIYFPSTENGSTYLLDTSITLPENCTLKFADGAKISGTATITGTYTKISAGLYQIFDGVTLAGDWQIPHVEPEWFGAKASGNDGTTDNSTAFTNAYAFASSNSVIAVVTEYSNGTAVKLNGLY